MRAQASTTALLRRTNAELVLQLLRDAGPHSVTELQKRTGLSRPTVDAVADDLIAWSLARATTAAAGSKGGRPGRVLAFRPDAAYVIGIDIGRRAVTATITDLAGTELASRTKRATAQMSRRQRLAAVRRSIDAVLEAAELATADIVAAGVGTPGPVDTRTGTTGICHVLNDWTGEQVGERIAGLLDCDVAVEKDANLAAVAEVWRGAGTNCRDVVSLMVGERPGAGLIMNGGLVRGSLGWAGELYFWGEWNDSYGHVSSRIADRMNAELTDILGHIEPSDAAEYEPTPEVNIDLDAALPAMRSGNPHASEAVHRFAAGTAWTLSTITSLLGPERIVISGIPAPVATPFIAAWQRVLDEVVPDNPTELGVSPLREKAVTIGALRRALDLAESHLIPPPR